jgi:predicted Zn-dependent protease
MRNLILGLFLSIFIFGCATTKLPPVTSSDFSFQEDEKRLWTRSEEEQERIGESGLVYRNKRLDAYLNSVARKLQPPEVYEKIPFKIYVLEDPHNNAFAYPNGAIYVHSGILSRMDNEAQLATLLAHEMTHATHRHQVREFRGLLNRTAVFASVHATVGGVPAVGSLTSALGKIGTRAAISGHSRGLETEADMEGIKLVMKAGYEPEEAPKLFQHIQKELEEEKIEEPYFFGSHPRLQDRIQNYQDLLENNTRDKKGIINKKVFRKKTARVVLDNAFLDLKEGRFQSALRGGEKYLAVWPKSPRCHYLLGTIYKQRGQEGDLERAKKYYRKTISLNKSYAPAYKNLGVVYFKQGKKSKARKAFYSYLKLSPKAADREYVKEYIAECGRRQK